MSTLVTNTITGLSTAANITIGSTPVVSASANSLTIRGEGSAQTSVQQGLAKSWLSATIISNTHTIQDSFNVGSITDDGAGRTDLVFTNNMANDDYSATQASALSGSNVFPHLGQNTLVTTSHFRNNTANDGGTIVDYDILCATVHGDLA